ncbi:MAG: NMD3-related protein [Candidatus ainarchaeum sp.]|nr:NMD3-related protein [Candidatus ainarchaeum sp.]
MHDLVCPRCGATNEKTQFMGPFCIDCAPFKLECPKEFSIELCPKCGKMRIARDWIKFDAPIIEKLLRRKCKGNIEKMEYDPYSGKATFFINKDNNLMQVSRDVEFKPIKNLCPNCSRKSSGYFEAIIQLRGRPERIAKYEKLLTTALKEKTFIAKTEQKKEGKDLYVGDSKQVVALFRELGLKVVISRTLHGLRQGKRLYRTTFLLRL